MEHNAPRLGSYLVGDSLSADYQIPTFFLFARRNFCDQAISLNKTDDIEQKGLSKNYRRSQTMRTTINGNSLTVGDSMKVVRDN